ncbi:uncharacterized mitochondrial protein-like protein [Tanacetum coccineum]
MTVVKNEKNELIPQRTVIEWRVCIVYRKLNDATRKDHFSLAFIDQMLERLAGHEYYYFPDSFSGYFQILIALEDQEKTTFTCPYGTFAYKRMPFGLCNAPSTFQRLMTSNNVTFIASFIPYSEEEVAEIMAETMEQYMSKTRADYGSGIARPKIDDKDSFKLRGQFLKELYENTFSGSDHEDVNEYTEKVLEIVDLFHIPNITQDQVMLKAFHVSLTGATSRCLRKKPSGSITTWEDLKIKFLSKYCPPARIAKKMEEINNFQQEPKETLYQAWEQFKELLMKYPQHYLTEMQEAQLNNLGREIKKVNEKVYAAQVGCEQCKGPHYTKYCPLKEEGTMQTLRIKNEDNLWKKP